MSTRRRVVFAGTLGAIAAVVFAGSGSCGQSQPSPAQPATVDASTTDSKPDAPGQPEAGAPDAAAEADVAVPWDGPDGCAPFDPPPVVPAGWERYTGWSCECPLYIRGANGVPLPPVEWEPCAAPIPQSLGCRQMKDTWNGGSVSSGIFYRFSVDPSTGKVLLAFDRMSYEGNPSTRYRIVAEADGPVRTAFLQVNPFNKGCEFGYDGLTDDTYVLAGLGDTWDGGLSNSNPNLTEGFIAGHAGSAYPDAVFKAHAPQVHSDWYVSPEWIVQNSNVYTAWSWDLLSKRTVYNPAQDQDHLPGGLATLVGKEVFVEVGDGLPAGVMVWDADNGLRPLIRWYGDGSQGAGNFTTDGKNMVWTYVQGADHGDGTYDTMSVMTAPYTADGAQALATMRRVRSDVKGFDPYPWAVGCGYAARSATVPALGNNALYIVRLSDGVSWLLPDKLDLPSLHWSIPLGATCGELFTTVDTEDGTTHTITIARIRLDSLGPGTPPD